MTDQFIGVYNDNREEYIIIELTAKDVRTIAQALHVMKIDNPENKTYQHAMKTLVDQTDYVFPQSSTHQVYSDPLTMTGEAKTISPIYYKPVDFYD